MTDEEWLADLLASNGYPAGKVLADGRYAAVVPKFFTHAVVVGQVGDDASYDDSWCYETRLAAVAAMNIWDGGGEPVGWHRHPRTGRRVSKSAGELDVNRQRVGAVGVKYVRP